MDDSLEALLEKATNPKNRYEDWEFIMAFCDKVNAEMEGPQVALKIIVPKIQDKNEKIALLGLALLEACVKNCGRRFHQELGKFRFLNELIRMISPKYLGNEIPVPVQTKIKSLLYSWKVGLPNETKIADAYEMLKKQGLIFDESVGPDPTLESAGTAKPKVTLREDPKQSEMLGKLIKSNNPEDLRAANRLIRDMVRRDEKRMEKLKKRLDELELISNNIKLLNEMLSHYKPNASEHEKQIIEELHSSVEKMRPQLFRMASELQPSEEGMTEILQTNDALIRVLDHYQRTINGGDGKLESDAITNGLPPSSSPQQETTPSNNATGGPAGDTTNDLLLDLADLNFGNPPTPPTSVHQFNSGDNSLLLDDIGLGLPVIPTINTSSMSSLPPLDITSVPPQPPVSTSQTGTSNFDLLGDLNLFSNSMPPASATTPPTAVKGLPPFAGMPSMGMPSGVPPTGAMSSVPGMPSATGIPSIGTPSFTSPTTGGLPPSTGNLLGGLGAPVGPPMPSNPQTSTDPFSVLDTLSSVTIESIVPSTTYTPLSVLNKGGISVSLLFTQNSTSPDAYVMVISTISTNPFPVSNYLVQAAAPKVMKVKLQSPTGTELPPYNPLAPPPSVSQIMLLANPSKASIRLRFRISYVPQGGTEVVEIAEVSF